MKTPLKVYKASAGSGKTFTLAVEYITLLIVNPTIYKNILAVTFTKKATGEMKNRILSQLYGISKSLRESEGYFSEIKKAPTVEKLNLSDIEIRRRAGMALSNIIHDYSRFHITTIDSFFQSIIRELARELELTANLRVDLNDAGVLNEAVTSIIDELEEGTYAYNSIMKYVMERINDGKNWIIADDIEKFGHNIFNEKYLEKEWLIRDKIGDNNFMENYKSELYCIKEKIIETIRELGNTFFRYINEDSYTQDHFKQKSKGIYAFFNKLHNGELPTLNTYVRNCIGNNSEWLTDKKELIDHRYLDLLNKSLQIISDGEKNLSTLKVIISHINQLMMLNAITTRVRTLNQESNRFLLADTARFLRNIIDNNDIPFIYERTGNRYKHIMIDEFQDTSSLQWENFKPLLYNSLSQGLNCLLVGDVKQSIYRWRNSDWNILNSIQDSEFKDEIDITSINRLDTNFRSMEEIVRFNNDFFAKAAEKVAGKYDESCGIKTHDIDKAYQSVKQKIYNKNLGKGYVSVCDIQIPTGSEYNYTDLSLKHINSKINEIISKGISPNEIAILVREKKQIEKICLFFSQSVSDIKVISEEAYKLSASSAVNLIIEALTCIANPQSIISRLTLAYLYQTEVLGDETFRYDIDNLICEAALNYNDETDSKEQVFKTLLPESFYKQFENFSITPLSELCEILYDIFELKKIEKQDAYLFSFYDCLTSYLADNPDDINEFLNKWNEEYKDTTIPGNSLDGIRIMTIHKSKGLEFHTVIVPFCHWSMDGKSDTILWCQPNEAPYDKLPLTPINYIKDVQKSIFKKDYDEETLKCYVDNLNLIYVAFTRAESNLFIFTGNHGNGYTANKVIMSSLPERMTKEAIDDITTFYTIGSLLTATESNINKEDNDENEEVNIMTKQPTKLELQFEHYSSHPQFHQSNESKHFISSDSIPNNYIDEGNIIHHVLEYVYTLNDIPNAVKRVEIEGGFKNEEQRKRIVSIINNGFENKQVQEWFDKKWTVLNERAILSWNSDECISPIRPDRVITDGEQTIVIDYKTGVQNNRYNEQVQNYIDHLYRAGKRNIKGYIWYIATGEVIPV